VLSDFLSPKIVSVTNVIKRDDVCVYICACVCVCVARTGVTEGR